MEFAHMLGFIRMGDYVASLLKDASRASGLNLTQAMICWHLLEHAKPGGLNLTELSRLTASTPARVQVQLKQLDLEGWVQVVPQPADGDRRIRRYVLSRKGRCQTQVFIDHADQARGKLWEVVFSGSKEQADRSAWGRMNYRLLNALRKLPNSLNG